MGRRVRTPLLLMLAFGWMSAWHAPAADAQSRRDKREARKHEEQGKAFYRTGAYDSAIVEFERSYALDPKPTSLFNLGICHQKLGNHREARDFYQQYLDTNPPEGVTETRARIEALDRLIAEEDAKAKASVDAEARRAKGEALYAKGRQLADANKFADAVDLYEQAFAVEPNPEIVFDMAEALRLGGDKARAAVEYQRYRDLAPSGLRAPQALEYKARLEAEVQEEIARAEREKRAAEERAAAEEAKQNSASARVERMPSGRKLQVAGIATAGVGGVALVVGAVFGSKAKGLESDVTEFEGGWTTALDQKVEDGESANKLAITSYVVGGLAVAAGGTLFLLGQRQASAKRRARARTTLIPTVSPSGAGFAIAGSF